MSDTPGPSGTNLLRVSSSIFKRKDVQPSTAVCAIAPSEDQDDTKGLSKPALRMRRHRERLKQNGKFAEYRAKETVHSQKYRKNRSEEQMQHDREDTKGLSKPALRMRRHRERLKQNGKFAEFRAKETVHSQKYRKNRSEEQMQRDREDTKGLSKPALRMRRHRERLKQNGKFAEYRAKETVHSQKYRKNRSEEQMQRDRENTKIRVQLCREKKKEQGIPLNKEKILTRAGQEAVREANRLRQQKCRANRSYQKKAAVNKNSRYKEAAKRAAKLESSCRQTPSSGLHQSPFSGKGYCNPDTRRKAVKKAQQAMPVSPSEFAAVVDSLIKTRSPQKRKALRELGILPPLARKKLLLQADLHEEVVSTCQKLQKSRKTGELKK